MPPIRNPIYLLFKSEETEIKKKAAGTVTVPAAFLRTE